VTSSRPPTLDPSALDPSALVSSQDHASLGPSSQILTTVNFVDAFVRSPLAQAELDPGWVVNRANPAWSELLGSGAGMRWFDLIHPDDLTGQLSTIGNLQTGAPAAARLVGRVQVVNHGWQRCEFVISTTLVDDQPVSVAMILPHAVAHPQGSEEVTEDCRHLAAALSHDVRQHARLISAYGSLLARSALDQRQKSYLGVVADHADRLQRVLTSLVRWLRVTDEAPRIASCDLSAVWANITAGLPADIELSDLPLIRADPQLMAEMLRELATNAVHYHPSRAKLALTVTHQDDRWLLSVTDDGMGIPFADRQRVLHPLHRLHSWEQVPGLGMGLTIAARIANRHGGALTITDAPGGGCQVQVYLPV
jgi:signal transduction histidine kinase